MTILVLGGVVVMVAVVIVGLRRRKPKPKNEAVTLRIVTGPVREQSDDQG